MFYVLVHFPNLPVKLNRKEKPSRSHLVNADIGRYNNF